MIEGKEYFNKALGDAKKAFGDAQAQLKSLNTKMDEIENVFLKEGGDTETLRKLKNASKSADIKTILEIRNNLSKK